MSILHRLNPVHALVEVIQKFNPNHDNRGRFSSSSGGRSISPTDGDGSVPGSGGGSEATPANPGASTRADGKKLLKVVTAHGTFERTTASKYTHMVSLAVPMPGAVHRGQNWSTSLSGAESMAQKLREQGYDTVIHVLPADAHNQPSGHPLKAESLPKVGGRMSGHTLASYRRAQERGDTLSADQLARLATAAPDAPATESARPTRTGAAARARALVDALPTAGKTPDVDHEAPVKFHVRAGDYFAPKWDREAQKLADVQPPHVNEKARVAHYEAYSKQAAVREHHDRLKQLDRRGVALDHPDRKKVWDKYQKALAKAATVSAATLAKYPFKD